ncbi:glycosyltransferase family 2 protein [Salegentibacter chungangensis]|uniref:Glycosyltransferase family 2 protein n=1 Tax=Salegentibacter chungangensis TaxID=1335724 RepID=A0ABW3NT45_9FLAO
MACEISVIIPTYNRSHTVWRAIESVIHQTSGNWELIIIDDGSTDDTASLVRDYLEDDRITYHRQANSGVSAARNKGAELSKGNYLLFLDSDDSLRTNLFFRLKESGYSDYDLISWGVLKLTPTGDTIWKPKKLEKLYNCITASFLAGSICYRKEIFLEAGGYDENMLFGENYELGIRVSHLKNLKVKILDEVFLDYYMKFKDRPSSKIKNKLISNKYLYNKHQEKYLEDKFSNSRFNYLMGYLNEKNGNRLKAKDYYLKALAIDPIYVKPIVKVFWFRLKFLIGG